MVRLIAREAKRILRWLIPLLDVLASPAVALSALVLRVVRRVGVARLPLSRRALFSIGVFPILDHYYEPLFTAGPRGLSFDHDRYLPGIRLNDKAQLALLEKFCYNEELLQLPLEKKREGEFYYHNGSFESGDAEYLYNMVRHFKPRRIVEIGAGFSTLLIRKAIDKNRENDSAYSCEHICVEPFENQWLETVNVTVVRKPVESVDKSIFYALEANDILFIDSSHVIRPQGDVLSEYLEILPILKKNVLVHVHDIFTPRDYPERMIVEEVRFWNEQYLLEAFLSGGTTYDVIGAVNYLARQYPESLGRKCPVFSQERSFRQPGSFWIRKESD